jgi:hypothetical protein
LFAEFESAGKEWSSELNYLWAFGPKRQGANILLNHIPSFKDSNMFQSLTNKLDVKYEPKKTVKKVCNRFVTVKGREW